jgi:hypothetical protein
MPCGCVLLAYLGLSILDGPPRTLRFEITYWRNQSWGLHNIDRSETRCNVAIARDSSRSNRCESENFRFYFVPNAHWASHSLYNRSEHTGFEIDDAARSASGGPCACTWESQRLEAGDTDCTTSAARNLGVPGRPVGTGFVAGHQVLRYVAPTEDGGRQEVSLAPALDCEVMEAVHVWKGTVGIPGAKWHYVVTDYVPGEPDKSQFQIPAGYSVRKGVQ